MVIKENRKPILDYVAYVRINYLSFLLWLLDNLIHMLLERSTLSIQLGIWKLYFVP